MNASARIWEPISPSNIGIGKRGLDLWRAPGLNKSPGFTEAERQAPGLVALPAHDCPNCEGLHDRVRTR